MKPVRYPLVSQKGGSKKFFTFGVAFHFFVAGNRRQFKIGF